jgi:hypothetical protein
VNRYCIKVMRHDMPKDFIDINYKWANTEKDAVKLILKKTTDKSGVCVFKRGGSGRILSIEKIENDI